MKLQRLTIYLLRDVDDFDDAVDTDGEIEEVALAEPFAQSMRFYYSVRPANRPAWLAFVEPALVGVPAEIMSSSSSGLLLVSVQDRMFAVTFGYGRGLLDQAKIQRQFGLKVALNAVDPAQLRSMDTKTFDDLVVTRTTQSSRSSDLPTFGIDITRDILRAATGVPKETAIGRRISGSDSVVVQKEIEVADLSEYCMTLLETHERETYKADFGWIDQLSLVSDRSLVTRLDQLVVDQLRAGDTSRLHLATPDPMDPGDIGSFRINGTGYAEYDELDIDSYLAELGDQRNEIALDRLKRWKVGVRYVRSSELDYRWTVYNCLVADERIGNEQYALIEGRWFAISSSLSHEVNEFSATISASVLAFPVALFGETEPAYIKRIVSELGKPALNVDGKVKRPGGAASGIELCDLLTSDCELVHIKRKSRSSTLSHLFAQGRISAVTLLEDGPFRNEVRKMIKSAATEPAGDWLDIVPPGGQRVNASQYTVSYVVIARSSRAVSGNDWLPFFSKLNLMNTSRELQRMGFKTTLTRVEVM